MPKLVLPSTGKSIEVYSYGKAQPRHIRAIAKYMYEYVHSATIRSLFHALFPSLTEEQLDTLLFIRLKDLSQMTNEQVKEIMREEK